MRDDLRRTCSAIWVIDCSPEGHQPDTATRIFQGVQQPVCIVLAAKTLGKPHDVAAPVLFKALPTGGREEKFKALEMLTLSDAGWVECPANWRAPFLPAAQGLWADFAKLSTLFAYNGSGVMPGRTWIIAPDSMTLEQRWERLVTEKNAVKKEILFHAHFVKEKKDKSVRDVRVVGDRHLNKELDDGLAGHEVRKFAVAVDKGRVVTPVRYALRTLDRQWIIPDKRLINRPNPRLWSGYSERQLFVTAPEDRSIESGPAISLAGLMPDLHHYNGRGGRVYPLWADPGATASNIRPELLRLLARRLGRPVPAEDVFAYIAGVMAHPAFTARFRDDLKTPGLRLPLTAETDLFDEAVGLGREVVWLHTYGERFADAEAGRPSGPPRLAPDRRPTIPTTGRIPSDRLPETMRYDAATRRLHVGDGFVENVTPEMAAYEVSGKVVLDQWFSYRRADRSKPPMGDKRPPSPLEDIKPDGWLPEYTTDLLDLLNALGRLIDLEPAQADLLDRICKGPLIKAQALAKAGLAETAAIEAASDE